MPNSVLIDFERMKYPHTGLFHFCLHLGKNLSKYKKENQDLFFYLPKTLNGHFGNNVHYINQHFFHKIFFPSQSKYKIWHAAQQGTEYFPFGARCKKVLTIHDINFMYDNNKSDQKKATYLTDLTRKINESDVIVAISNFVMQDVLKHIYISPEKRRVVYNGCNIIELENIKAPNNAPSTQFLYSIGVIAEKKNFHVLPALLRNNKLQLIISGIVENEQYKNRIIEEAKKYGVESRVVFTGPVSENDKQWYYKNCTAFVFPSLSEGFGLPVIEAMYFGKPVILSSTSSLPEVGGEYAYYFNNFEPEDMERVLKECLLHFNTTNPSTLIKQWANSFSWEKAAKEYLAIYDSLIK